MLTKYQSLLFDLTNLKLQKELYTLKRQQAHRDFNEATQLLKQIEAAVLSTEEQVKKVKEEHPDIDTELQNSLQ